MRLRHRADVKMVACVTLLGMKWGIESNREKMVACVIFLACDWCPCLCVVASVTAIFDKVMGRASFLGNPPFPHHGLTSLSSYITGDENGIEDHFLTALQVSRPRTACLFSHSLSTGCQQAAFDQTLQLIFPKSWAVAMGAELSSKVFWKFSKVFKKKVWRHSLQREVGGVFLRK